MIIEINSVNKSYIDGYDRDRKLVLRDISLKVNAGETVAIVGQSGCGKSTLLNLMGALDVPDSGSITVNGKELSKLSPKEAAATRAEDIGFVFQSHHLLPQATVIENVTLPSLAVPKKRNAQSVKARAMDLLCKVGISEHANQFPGQLSGGERQRAAVVRSLINKPSLLLADEPTGALDAGNADDLTGLLLDLNKSEGIALVVVTHNEKVASKMDRKLTIQSGLLQELE